MSAVSVASSSGSAELTVLRRNQLAVAIVKHRNTNGYQPLTS